MLFVIIGRDGPGAKGLRPRLRPAHLEHVRSRGDRVKLAGPLTDGAGSLFVVDLDTIEDAHLMMDADPYVTGGVFENVEVHPFVAVFPEKEGA